MMSKTDALFLKIAGSTIVLLLGIFGYYQKETYETIKEQGKAQQETQIEVKVNKSEVDGMCKVFDLRLDSFDRRITIVEKQLNIENNDNGTSN